MTKVETYCQIENGKLHVISRAKFLKAISELKDGRYVLTIDRKYNKRSNQQNAYYWSVVVELVMQGLKDAGFDNYDKDRTHDLIRLKFLKFEDVSSNGEVIENIKSTTQLTTSEYMEFLSNIKTWSMEWLNVYIPEPNEQTEFNFN